ncbi:MAG: hypothetical protein GF330_13040 [Candidatus Eisenbacteria bacterium]|nr:hypothetical protein [Candidatus Eisenbacteria bacterium]
MRLRAFRRPAGPGSQSHPLRLAAGMASLLILVLPLGCGSDEEGGGDVIRHPQDFLVNDVAGWEMTPGTLETALTIDELRDAAVNGSYIADAVELHNFREWAGAGYLGNLGGGEARVTLWIFEQQSPTDALALYNDSESGIAPPTSESPDQEIGDEARIYVSGLNATTLDFVRGTRWVYILIDRASDDAEQVLQLFAASVDQKMTP